MDSTSVCAVIHFLVRMTSTTASCAVGRASGPACRSCASLSACMACIAYLAIGGAFLEFFSRAQTPGMIEHLLREKWPLSGEHPIWVGEWHGVEWTDETSPE